MYELTNVQVNRLNTVLSEKRYTLYTSARVISTFSMRIKNVGIIFNTWVFE